MVMEQMMNRAGERPGGPLAVSTAGLTKRFGDRTVVDDVALAIPSGSVWSARPRAAASSSAASSATPPATCARSAR
jgi:hypothetical protein